MEPDDLAALADNIRQPGLRTPIVIYEIRILDRRNRVRVHPPPESNRAPRNSRPMAPIRLSGLRQPASAPPSNQPALLTAKIAAVPRGRYWTNSSNKTSFEAAAGQLRIGTSIVKEARTVLPAPALIQTIASGKTGAYTARELSCLTKLTRPSRRWISASASPSTVITSKNIINCHQPNPLGFGTSANLHRRHVTTSRRALPAARMATLTQAAKEGRDAATPAFSATLEQGGANQKQTLNSGFAFTIVRKASAGSSTAVTSKNTINCHQPNPLDFATPAHRHPRHLTSSQRAPRAARIAALSQGWGQPK